MSDRLLAETETAMAHDRSGGPAGRRIGFWIAVTAAALLLRIALLPIGARYGALGDHVTFVRWGMQAADKGVLTVYDQLPAGHDARVQEHGRWVTKRLEEEEPCNYPPLSIYLLYGSGLVFRAIGEPLANTVTARAVFGGWSILCDFLLAAGCAALASQVRPGPANRRVYAAILFLPPIWFDTIIWGQVDTTVLAPLVWTVWAMVRRRWLLAGVLWGAALMIKTHGILLLPVWGCAILAMRPIRGPLLGLAAAAASAMLISLPFTVGDGLAWLRSSYLDNLLRAYPATTLKSFNLWYLDLLRCDCDDVTRTLLGISKDAWGKILLGASLAGGFGWLARRWGRRQAVPVLWSAWALLACVMLPTRVHERYLVMALPLLAVAATLRRLAWPGLAALTVVACAQLTWPAWLNPGAGDWPRVREQAVARQATLASRPGGQAPSQEEAMARTRRKYLAARAGMAPYEWAVLGLSLAGAAWAAGAILLVRPEQGPQQGSGHGMPGA